jgi:hypothetical protein
MGVSGTFSEKRMSIDGPAMSARGAAVATEHTQVRRARQRRWLRQPAPNHPLHKRSGRDPEGGAGGPLNRNRTQNAAYRPGVTPAHIWPPNARFDALDDSEELEFPRFVDT